MTVSHKYLIILLAAVTLGSDSRKISSVEGRVTFDSRQALPAVTVQLDDLGRGTHVEKITQASGYYLFDQVRPGAYSMWVEADEYGCILVPRLAVHYGQRVRRDFNFERGKPHGSCDSVETKNHSER